MRKPASMKTLEKFGRVRLSPNFFMRDMLYSEIANFHGIPNIPDHPDLAIEAGKRLCEELLEPLLAAFGQVSIRSAFRSAAVNDYGHQRLREAGASSTWAAPIARNQPCVNVGCIPTRAPVASAR